MPRPKAEARSSGTRAPRSNVERNANSAVAIRTYTGIAISATSEEIA